nr:ribonuclease H-like domain-containing protein [Tanacetum cinerariifolium]
MTTQPVSTTGPAGLPSQATTLLRAFNAVTLQDPANGAWNMDTGASSHLNNSVNSLSENFNTCNGYCTKGEKQSKTDKTKHGNGMSESIIPLNDIISQEPPSNLITTSPPVLLTEDPEDSLIMGNEELNTIPKKESDEFIKSSVEDLVPILSESEDTFGSDSECILPSCDDFSPIDILEEKAMTFSNPLFNSNDDFISSDDESLFDKDVSKVNVKIYLNPLFEFNDEYISSDINPLFDEVLEDIECKDSYAPNLDKSTFLVTPLFDSNEDEYFTQGDDVELLLHHDLSIPKMSVASIFEGFIDEPPLEENDDLLDLEPKNDDWKKILYDAPNLMSEDTVFNPGIHDQIFSPTYVSLPFTDRRYLFFTYVVRIFLPHITYPVVYPFLISSGSEDTIFNPDIFAFHFSHRSGTFI